MNTLLSTAYSTPTPHEIIQLYERMRVEGLLPRVVQGCESLEEFQEIAAYPTFQLVREVPASIGGTGGTVAKTRSGRTGRTSGGSSAQASARTSAGAHSQTSAPTFSGTPDGPIAGFWWLSPVYGAACAFHFCLFRPYRARAASLFQELSARIFASGFSAIFAFSNARHHDLSRFCRGVGFKHIETINNINQEELNIWVAKPAAYSKTS